MIRFVALIAIKQYVLVVSDANSFQGSKSQLNAKLPKNQSENSHPL